MERVHKPRTKLENSAEKQIEDKGPFPSEAIRQNTKDDLKEQKPRSASTQGRAPEKRNRVHLKEPLSTA